MACTCTPENNGIDQSMEQYIRAKQQREDQLDYQFVQRIIQELTQSCALNLPIPASAIPPLILQAAQFFWANDDRAVEERWYCLPNSEFNRCGPNKTAKLPDQIISVFGVYKSTDQYSYGVMGDFSLERMLLNSSALASSSGASMSNVYGAAGGYNLMDVTAALYEVNTFKAMFDSPLTFNYNAFSGKLVLLGDLGSSDLLLATMQRCKIQDLYNNYYFFRYVVCLCKRALSTIYGMYEFKLPGGISINYSNLSDQVSDEMDKIDEWIQNNRAVDYFFMPNSL